MVIIIVASLSNICSIAGRTKRIIKDSTKEISNSNKGSKKSKNKGIMNRYYKYPICKKYIKPVSFIWTCEICNCILYFSYTTIEDWYYLYYKDPFQNILD
jgi:sugar phosphate permease